MKNWKGCGKKSFAYKGSKTIEKFYYAPNKKEALMIELLERKGEYGLELSYWKWADNPSEDVFINRFHFPSDNVGLHIYPMEHRAWALDIIESLNDKYPSLEFSPYLGAWNPEVEYGKSIPVSA